MSDDRDGGGIFYGWILVGVLSIVLFNTAGMSLYSFPVFIESLQHEFGWTMTDISYGVAIWAIVFGFASPAVGVAIGRFGIRATMLVCAILASLAHLGMATCMNIWWFYGTLVIAAVAAVGVTTIPSQTLVTNWFNRYRGRAMAMTLVGVGAGGATLPPLCEYLIRIAGWRSVWYMAIAALWILVIPLIAIFIRTRPSDLGLTPDGILSEHPDAGGPAVEVSGLPVKRAIRTPAFAVLMGVFILHLMGGSPLGFHFVPFVNQEIGFTAQQAAKFLGVTVGCGIAGRILFGWLADRWSVAALIFVASALLTSGPFVLEVVFIRMGHRDPNLLWLYSIPFGIGGGGSSVTFPILVSRCFGELNFSKILGIMMSGFALGIIVSVPVAGKVFDVTGSYEYMLLGCGTAYLLSTVLILFIRPDRYRGEYVTEG